MKVKQTLREIVDKTRAREKYSKRIYLIALIPTVVFSLVALYNIGNSWDLSRLILFPFAIAGFYLIMVMTVLDIIFGYSIYEVLSPSVNTKVNAWNNKIKRFFNTPNRIDELEQKINSKNTLVNPTLEKILKQIGEDYKTLDNKKVAFCMVCGECLGEYRENCAKEHLQKYPNHDDFMVKRIIDPLLSSPDEWFEKQKIVPDHIDPTIFDKNKIRRRFDRICFVVLSN